ncbi:MAG: hypothetical protein IPM39_26170 [Chloroflexi bacterium]|nr:hypothetical protein [Chloroflexota bacterium]
MGISNCRQWVILIVVGRQVLTVRVPFPDGTTEIGLSYRVPTGFLVLSFWLVGSIMLWFTRPENQTAIWVAYIFVGLAVALTGVQAEILSVTGAWLSRPVWYMSVMGIFYLGGVPRFQPLSQSGRRMFGALWVLAGLLGLLALAEALFLFPNHTSLDTLSGLGFYELLLLVGGVAWLTSFFQLVIRIWRVPASSYQRKQLIILLLFIGLAIMPVTLLTLVPRGLADVVLLPFPLAISLFVLVPAGYLFVIFRRGYLGFDVVFSKTALFLILALVTLVVYGSALAFIRGRISVSTTSVLPETLIFLPVLFLVLYMSKPVDLLIRELFFGEVVQNKSLPLFTLALSLKPDISTLEAIVAQLAQDFQIPQALLALIQNDGQLNVITTGHASDLPVKLDEMEPLTNFLLRSDARTDSRHTCWTVHPWSELILPIRVRDDLIGYLAFARPQGGYFNTEQVVFLTQAASIIAVGSEAIFLFNVSRYLSLQVLSARETERKNLSKDIHDRPVQSLAYSANVLHQVLLTPDACSPAVIPKIRREMNRLQHVMEELRDISKGLFPPPIEMGLQMIVSDNVIRFERQFGLTIEQNLQASDAILYQPPPLNVGTAVYGIVMESLNNVVKHAQTKRAWITVSETDECLRVEIADDGVGCNISSFTTPELIRQGHLGLVGMRDRTDLVRGRLTIQPRQPRGTAVILEIPLEDPRWANL